MGIERVADPVDTEPQVSTQKQNALIRDACREIRQRAQTMRTDNDQRRARMRTLMRSSPSTFDP